MKGVVWLPLCEVGDVGVVWLPLCEVGEYCEGCGLATSV